MSYFKNICYFEFKLLSTRYISICISLGTTSEIYYGNMDVFQLLNPSRRQEEKSFEVTIYFIQIVLALYTSGMDEWMQ